MKFPLTPATEDISHPPLIRECNASSQSNARLKAYFLLRNRGRDMAKTNFEVGQGKGKAVGCRARLNDFTTITITSKLAHITSTLF